MSSDLGKICSYFKIIESSRRKVQDVVTLSGAKCRRVFYQSGDVHVRF